MMNDLFFLLSFSSGLSNEECLSRSHLRLPLAPPVGEVGVDYVVEGAGHPAADCAGRPRVILGNERASTH